MDHSSQAEVIPSESLHDILQCQLDQEDSQRLWLYTPRNSLLQLQCGGLSPVTVIKSSPTSSSSQQGSCAGYKPSWRLEPLLYRVNPLNFMFVTVICHWCKVLIRYFQDRMEQKKYWQYQLRRRFSSSDLGCWYAENGPQDNIWPGSVRR